MSAIDSNDLEATGYFLPKDSWLRLKKLREFVAFLANLARPRTSDERKEWIAEIRVGEVAICLELLEEQIGQVLDELSWPAERGEMGASRSGNARPAAGEADAEAPEASEAQGMEVAEPYAAEEEADSVGARYLFGVTLDQINEITLLLERIRAHGDVVIASDDAEFATGTLSIVGDVIFHDAIKLHEIVRDVNAQRLGAVRGPRTGVREEQAAYGAFPACLPMGSTSHVVPQHRLTSNSRRTGPKLSTLSRSPTIFPTVWLLPTSKPACDPSVM